MLCIRSFLLHLEMFVVAVSLLSTTANAAETPAPIEPVGQPINLLADNLANLYTWLKDTQHEDPRAVFTINDGILRISGDGWGGITTKNEYTNYHMICEFKWGEKTWGARKGRSRDSGLLIHCIGPDGGWNGVWMASIEAQIIEGGVGDFLALTGKHPESGKAIPVTMTAETARDRDGEMVWKEGGEKHTMGSGRVNWWGRDVDWADDFGFRGRDDVESPAGEWTRFDVICDGDKITNVVNGTIVNHCFDVKPSAGKILLQTEGAEILVRRWELWPLGNAPSVQKSGVRK